MKRALLITILIMFCGAGMFAQQAGEITELSGTVELKAAGQADFVPAKIGDRVTRDTIVSTGFRSTALIIVRLKLFMLFRFRRLVVLTFFFGY